MAGLLSQGVDGAGQIPQTPQSGVGTSTGQPNKRQRTSTGERTHPTTSLTLHDPPPLIEPINLEVGEPLLLVRGTKTCPQLLKLGIHLLLSSVMASLGMCLNFTQLIPIF